MRRTRRTFWGIIAIGLAPLAIAIFGMTLAAAFSCEISDNFTSSPCPIFGFDLTPLLSPMISAGWFGLLTLPLVGLVILVWTALEGMSLWRRRRRERKAARAAEI